MPPQTYEKQSIALAQLETALRLLREDQDLFSVLTLAGAAEEILGQLVKRRGGDNSLDSLKKTAVAIYEHLFGETVASKVFADRANRARNSLKHLDPSGPPSVMLDVREEAIDMLTRAIDNYWFLETSLTPAMEEFTIAQRAA